MSRIKDSWPMKWPSFLRVRGQEREESSLPSLVNFLMALKIMGGSREKIDRIKWETGHLYAIHKYGAPRRSRVSLKKNDGGWVNYGQHHASSHLPPIWVLFGAQAGG